MTVCTNQRRLRAAFFMPDKGGKEAVMDDRQVHTHQEQGDTMPPDGIPAVTVEAAEQALKEGARKNG